MGRLPRSGGQRAENVRPEAHAIAMPVKCDYDRDRLQGYLRSQDKVITRIQARGCGLSGRAIDYRLRPGGPWQRVLPGVYLAHTGAITLHQQQVAALLYGGEESALTGDIAARWHGLERRDMKAIDVLVPASERRQSRSFVRITRTRRMPQDLEVKGAVRVVPAARAVADAARAATRLDDARAIVSSGLQRNRCSFQELMTELEEGPSAGSKFLGIALTEVSNGARSNAEIDLHKLIDRSELEKPLYNASIYTEDHVFIAQADTWWQRAGVAGEVDSWKYHFKKAADYAATQKRHNRMESYGINVQHWLPHVIWNDSETVLEDLGRAIEAGCRRPPLRLITVVGGEIVPMPEFSPTS